MKTLFLTLVLSGFVLSSYAQETHDHKHDQKADSTAKAKPKSPRMMAMTFIGKNHVHIDFSSPSVRGRAIWNGLVAYNQIWVTGAHKATNVEFSQDVTINGKLIPKGKYGFFTIPNKDSWTLILSKDWDMHLADNYKQENDIIRVNVKPVISKTLVESLKYEVLPKGKKGGSIKMSWEYLSVSLDFENK